MFLWNYSNFVSEDVNLERQFSSAPDYLKAIFSNKLTVSSGRIIENYLFPFSPQFLYLKAETIGFNQFVYNIGYKGMFHVIELPLLILGLLFALKVNKKIILFLFLSIAMAPLPSALTFDQTYGARSIMLLPFLSIITGMGIFYFTGLISKYKYSVRLTIYGLLIATYIVLISGYVYQYFFRYSVYGDKYWNSSKIDLVTYLKNEKDNYDKIIVAGDSNGLVLYYAFYNKLSPEITQKVLLSDTKIIDNIEFIKECIGKKSGFDPEKNLPENTLYVTESNCYEDLEIIPYKVITWRDFSIHVDYKVYKN